MFKINNISPTQPYKIFIKYLDKASFSGQSCIDAMSISSFNNELMEVDSRFVNLKYINGDEWIFFTNYNSPKAIAFECHNQISALFYWDKINLQIRIKAKISKCSEELSNAHFDGRAPEKNAIAISSKQSQPIESYEKVISNYHIAMENIQMLKKRPSNWGGFSFIPYYFEFWEGHKSRINKERYMNTLTINGKNIIYNHNYLLKIFF